MKEGINKEDDERRWLILRSRLFEEKVKIAFRFFRRNNIEPILIKGWAAAIEYPLKYQRLYGDIDLSVAPKDYSSSRKLLETEEGKQLLVDLHCGLRHLDIFQWDELFSKSKLVSLDDESIRVLCPEDHLRVLSTHWLTDGGCDKERLLDIYHILNNYRDQIDWERLLEQSGRTRKNWYLKTIGAVYRYYELDVSEMPFDPRDIELPKWFVKTVENEWSEAFKLKPIQTVLSDKKQFWQQIKKRFPPNPVQATIDMNGMFLDSRPFLYQLGSILIRSAPSLKRIWQTLKSRYKVI